MRGACPVASAPETLGGIIIQVTTPQTSKNAHMTHMTIYVAPKIGFMVLYILLLLTTYVIFFNMKYYFILKSDVKKIQICSSFISCRERVLKKVCYFT